MKRFQFVWWGLDCRRWGITRWKYGMRRIYRYSVNLGPLEIRRWEDA